MHSFIHPSIQPSSIYTKELCEEYRLISCFTISIEMLHLSDLTCWRVFGKLVKCEIYTKGKLHVIEATSFRFISFHSVQLMAKCLTYWMICKITVSLLGFDWIRFSGSQFQLRYFSFQKPFIGCSCLRRKHSLVCCFRKLFAENVMKTRRERERKKESECIKYEYHNESM